ncbi:tRNA synthetases class II core domain (F)-domain-containing protein [Pholiota molesta]|nr:tRNA synthetases class II core domain (F)-domain-containing protein [Pholiota molesta]
MSSFALCRRRACSASPLLSCLALRPRLFAARLATIAPKTHIEILGQRFPADDFTNITPAIISKTSSQLHLKHSHPLSTLRELIESAYPDFTHASSISPLVTPFKNFDELSFPLDHPGRAVTDSYYANRNMMLRTHTSAHEVEMFRKGETKWLLTADVYRRDEIDASHYPIFHHGLKEVEEDNERLSSLLASANILVAKNLKLSLNNLMLKIFGGVAGINKEHPLRVRWIEAYFPFTSPSFEVEVFFQGKWLEILGCGVVRQATLNTAGVPNKIAMDSRFLSQFQQGKINVFQPYSKYPSCFKDVSFWLSPDSALHENDFCDVVRDTAGDLVEDVKRIDHFVHPKTQRTSLCYRINYRSMDRSLSNDEVNQVQNQVIARLKEQFAVEIR